MWRPGESHPGGAAVTGQLKAARLRLRIVTWAVACVLAWPLAVALAQEDGISAPSLLSFPKTIRSETGTVVMHLPQIDDWKDFESVQGRLAVEVTPAGETAPVYGVAEFVADTEANIEMRVVAIDNAEVTVTSFPEHDEARRNLLDSIVRAAVQPQTKYLPLDVMLTYIAPDASIPAEEGLSYDPPPIFYSSTPAVLVNLDGEPILAGIPDTRLQYAVNTNWDLFRYRDREWYLRHDKRWLQNDELSGEWKWDTRLPGDFEKLPDDGSWTDAKAAIPAEKTDDDEPTVFVSLQPAELIVTDGSPQHRTIGSEGLEYIEDTTSDVFRYKFAYYYLVSGRWFEAGLLRGPWEPVKELPAVFASIPPDHEKAHVLAAVPDTSEARMAVLEASLPRKATIARDAGQNVSVFYEGAPIFETVPGTDVQRAVNSPNDILLIDNTYYLCDSAVWYVSTTADGPWVVADNIPAVIYSIPPSSPSYHVTHVVIDESDDQSVSTSYTSGYYGVSVSYGVAVYGTGWYYPPYWGYHPGYPYYYPYPYAFGASTWYNPNTGMYGRSGSVYGPYGGYGRAAAYNPQTGTYARGSAVWDSDEIAGSAVGYNPRTGTGVATNRYRNEYGGYGESLITQNDKWLQTRSEWDQDSLTTQFRSSEGATGEIQRQREGDYITGSGEFNKGDQSLNTSSIRGEQGSLVGFETGSGEQGAIGRSSDGDLYAGKDGNVYKKDEDGWHQQGEDGSWQPAEVPDERAAQMQERQSASNEARATNQNGAEGGATRRPESGSLESQPGNQARATADQRGFDGSAQGQPAARSVDASQSRGSIDARQYADLNRSYDARAGGYDRYNTRQSAGAGQARARPRRR